MISVISSMSAIGGFKVIGHHEAIKSQSSSQPGPDPKPLWTSRNLWINFSGLYSKLNSCSSSSCNSFWPLLQSSCLNIFFYKWEIIFCSVWKTAIKNVCCYLYESNLHQWGVTQSTKSSFIEISRSRNSPFFIFDGKGRGINTPW